MIQISNFQSHDRISFGKYKNQNEGLILFGLIRAPDVYSRQYELRTCVTNLGGNMARFTQFPLMITRSTIIYEIISPGAAGSSIYV